MNKKTILQGVVAIMAVALFAVLMYFVLGTPTVDTSQVTSGVAYGINSETGTVSFVSMSSEDVDLVASLFNGKEKSSDGPGDVFGEDCAFVLTDGDSEYYFCIAKDDSNYVLSANDDMYFKVSDEEMDVLMDLLGEYCGYRG